MRLNPGPQDEGRPIIALMAKAPIPGAVKTRLVPLLGAAASAALYRCFLEDTLATAAQVAGATVGIVCPDAEHRRALRDIVSPNVPIVAQEPSGLMAGLAWAFSLHFAAGASKVLLIDADSPTLPRRLLEAALILLDRVDVCLGPCPDGGYYLVGARRDVPGLFEGVAASTPATGQQTIARARAIGLSADQLEPWPDVDTEEDFRAFLTHLSQVSDTAPRSRSWLVGKGWLK